MTQQRDNSGALFRNTNKQEEGHADYSGTVTLAGVEYYIDGWLKPREGKPPFVSLRFKAKARQQEQRPERQEQPRRTGSKFDDFESDIPY